jgi:hypothetical protein
VSERHINATITQIDSYQPQFRLKKLPIFHLDDIRSGIALKKSSFILQMPSGNYAVSKWTGPKRSRTYPYQHVYDTIAYKPRVAIIPYFKDEGADGNPDYLQWDTVSLMSLLNVYVILGYFVGASPNIRNPSKRRITGHQLDADYVSTRFEELSRYHSDPIHWNMRELNDILPTVMQRALENYQRIETLTGVPLHSLDGLRKRIETIAHYQRDSRARALLAQSREVATLQPHERIASGLKASIHITNFFNGEYNLTVDEVIPMGDTLFLIEKKHSKKALPSPADMKDGILKLILYSSLDNAKFAGRNFKPSAILGLTSETIVNWCHSLQSEAEMDDFFRKNPQLTTANKVKIVDLFTEARMNRFVAYVCNAVMEDINQTNLLQDILQHQ